jgi:hypothetical protein
MEVIRYDLRTLDVGIRSSALACGIDNGREIICDGDAAAGGSDATEACWILLVCTFRFVWILRRSARPSTLFKCCMLGRIFVGCELMLLGG